jgi:hypothetical protein
MPRSDYRVAQLARSGKAAILDGDDDRMPGFQCGAYLPRITVAQPRARRAAWDEAATMEAVSPARADHRCRYKYQWTQECAGCTIRVGDRPPIKRPVRTACVCRGRSRVCERSACQQDRV